MNSKKENLSIRIPADLNKKFTEHVNKLGTSKNFFVLSLIRKALNRPTKNSST